MQLCINWKDIFSLHWHAQWLHVGWDGTASVSIPAEHVLSDADLEVSIWPSVFLAVLSLSVGVTQWVAGFTNAGMGATGST